MIHLQQDFDLHPASSRTRFAVVALACDALVPAECLVRYFPLPDSLLL